MDLIEYLASEHIEDRSAETSAYLHEPMSPEEDKQFSSNYQELIHYTGKPQLEVFYDFIAAHGLEKRFDELLVQRTSAEMATVQGALQGAASAIDIGCGSGLKLIYHALTYPSTQFLGIDLSGEMLKLAEERAKRNGCTNIAFQQADFYDISRTFDTVLAEHSLHEIMRPVHNPMLHSVDYDCMFPEKLAHLKELALRNIIITLMFSTNNHPLFPDPREEFLEAVTQTGLRVEAHKQFEMMKYGGLHTTDFFDIRKQE